MRPEVYVFFLVRYTDHSKASTTVMRNKIVGTNATIGTYHQLTSAAQHIPAINRALDKAKMLVIL
jgi:hypothetical protein